VPIAVKICAGPGRANGSQHDDLQQLQAGPRRHNPGSYVKPVP
jgi:hypothetical protein